MLPLPPDKVLPAPVRQFQLTQEEAAAKVGKSRAVVANALRLLKLPVVVQNYIRESRLSVGHAKVILGLAAELDQKLAAERVIKEGLKPYLKDNRQAWDMDADGHYKHKNPRGTLPRSAQLMLLGELGRD